MNNARNIIRTLKRSMTVVKIYIPSLYWFYRLRTCRLISVVGNGPISDSEGIDDSDLVIRFNKAAGCGMSGQRTDILVLVNWSHPGREFAHHPNIISPLAVQKAGMFWFTNRAADANQFRNNREANAPGDYSDQIIRRIVSGRPYFFIPIKNRIQISHQLRRHGSRPDVIPSTGIQTIHFLMNQAPRAIIRIYGFSHEGWDGHCWNAEKKWLGELSRVEKR